MSKKNKESTSWEGISTWYDKAVGDEGHYYHKHVIIPKLLPLLTPSENTPPKALLDLACGQGILSRHIPSSLEYVGVDISPSLLLAAKEKNTSKNCSFHLGDITKPLPIGKKKFQLCTIILALQNIAHPLKALQNAAASLENEGELILVMNHPCFRIPKQSSWGIDQENNIQYRRIDKYTSSYKVPIQSNPGLGKKSPETFSFHHPLSTWSLWLNNAGFAISWMEEWCSNKVSTGKYAQREDESRREIPLFLTIKARKLPPSLNG